MSDKTPGSQLSWQDESKMMDVEAEAAYRVVAVIAPMIKNICLSTKVPAVAVGLLLTIGTLAVEDGCSKKQFLQICEKAWDAVQFASKLAAEKLTTTKMGQA